MKRLLFYPLFLFAFLLMQYGCNKSTKELTVPAPKKTVTETKKPAPLKNKIPSENFDAFYTKFHADSVFQISRVGFPLKGYAMDTSENVKVWEKENWIMHKNTAQNIDTAVFKVETELGDKLYKEKIYIDGGGYASERIFKLINGKWFLVLFVDEDL